MSLKEYAKKRNFDQTPEPAGKTKKSRSRQPAFVIQKHDASRLHYDLRLEIDGALKSWAVPKGPSYDPGEKRLAVQVEDHPIDYGGFEGIIPEGNYGAGTVIVWDNGTYELTDDYGTDPLKGWEEGKLHVRFQGKKLNGTWILVRTRGKTGKEWLFFKKNDADALPGSDIIQERPESVKSGLTIEQLEGRKENRRWNISIEKTLESLDLKAGQKVPMPSHVGMMLCTPVEKPFDSPQWIFELKQDGIRALAYKKGGTLRMLSRNDLEMRARFPEVEKALMELPVDDAILDGEIVALDEQGRSSFQLLQPRMHLTRSSDIAARMQQTPVYFSLFDLLYCNGFLLTRVPLWKRKEVLRAVLDNLPAGSASAHLMYSDHVETEGLAFYKAAADLGLEGIIAKRRDSGYESRRSKEWLKIKCTLSQEFAVIGYTEPKGSRQFFGSLLLAVYEDGRFVFAGSSGGGLDTRTLEDVSSKLRRLETANPEADNAPKLKGVHWVKPKLVAEVRFSEWTRDGVIRHPVFLGLRDDKNPTQCVRELAAVGASEEARASDVVDTPVKTRAALKRTKNPNRAARAPARPASSPASAAARRGVSGARSARREPAPAESNADSAKPSLPALHRPVSSATAPVVPKTRHAIQFSNLDKVLWPEDGFTKRDLIAYYDRIAPVILPHLKDRPLNLERFPDGIRGQSFYQKNTPDYFPPWIPRVKVYSEDSRREVAYTVCNDRDTLLYLANLACIPHNPWSSRSQALDHPDFAIFDLDPEEAPFSQVQAVALKLRELLESIGLHSYPKTSGATGLHVFVPLKPEYSYDDTRQLAEVVGLLLLQRHPEWVTLERVIKKRKGKVYVDFLQNGKGKTVAGVYVLRPRPGAPVSTPLAWDEMEKKDLSPLDFNMRTLFARLDKTGDLFAPVLKKKQSLRGAMRALEKLAGG